MSKPRTVEAAVERVIDLEAELESAGEASTEGEALAFTRARLHEWIDTVSAVVVSAGQGRVTLIHDNGHQSGIASNELPFILSRPARFAARNGK